MRRVGAIRKTAFALASLCLGLLAAELTVRLFAAIGGEVGKEIADQDPLGVLYMPHGNYGYKQKPGRFQEYPNGTRANWNSIGYRGPEIEIAKPNGTYRAVLLGGSTSHGYGVDDDETIDAHMRWILRERCPTRRFEVVNLALGGYDSYQVYERMRMDGVPLDPDLVIINSGINDVRNAPYADLEIPDERTLLWESHMARMREEAASGGPGAWARLKHFSFLARMPGFVRHRLQIAPASEQMRTVTPRPDAVDYFETNLKRTAELADAAGASVIFSTPPSSLLTKYDPTDMSVSGYWIINAAATEEYRQRLATRMQELTQRLRKRGMSVAYVQNQPDVEMFIDDCHLTGDGNRVVAESFVEAMLPMVDAARGATRGGEALPACP